MRLLYGADEPGSRGMRDPRATRDEVTRFRTSRTSGWHSEIRVFGRIRGRIGRRDTEVVVRAALSHGHSLVFDARNCAGKFLPKLPAVERGISVVFRP